MPELFAAMKTEFEQARQPIFDHIQILESEVNLLNNKIKKKAWGYSWWNPSL